MAYRVYRKTGELRWKMTQNQGSWRATNAVEVMPWAISGYNASLGTMTIGHWCHHSTPDFSMSLCFVPSRFKVPGSICE